jgi:competence transcription factor ComK
MLFNPSHCQIIFSNDDDVIIIVVFACVVAVHQLITADTLWMMFQLQERKILLKKSIQALEWSS